jgi:hypothetical protein
VKISQGDEKWSERGVGYGVYVAFFLGRGLSGGNNFGSPILPRVQKHRDGKHLLVLERLLEGSVDARELLGWMMRQRSVTRHGAAWNNRGAAFNLRPPVDPFSLHSRQTPLYVASQCGNATAVTLLLRAGADPRRADVWNRGPEQVAANPTVHALLTAHRDELDFRRANQAAAMAETYHA